MQSPSFLGKYGRILLAMALFLALDLSVLLLNIFTADRLQTDGSEINIAGRQRMLSQRMTKVLFEMQDAQSHGNGIAPLQKELKTAFDLFDATFYAFLDGGTTRDSNLNVIQLSKIETPAAQEALQKAHKPWEAFKEAIRPTLLATDAIDADTLTQAIHFAAENNLSLLTNMNELTTALEQENVKKWLSPS